MTMYIVYIIKLSVIYDNLKDKLNDTCIVQQ